MGRSPNDAKKRKSAPSRELTPTTIPVIDYNTPTFLVTSLDDYLSLLDSLPIPDAASRDKSIAWIKTKLAQQTVSAPNPQEKQLINKKKTINVPGFVTADHTGIRPTYTYTNHYVKTCVYRDYVRPIRLSNGEKVEYDIRIEDIEFLEKEVYDNITIDRCRSPGEMKNQIEEAFISLINLWEMQTGFAPTPISIESAISLGKTYSLPAWLLRSIYNHWIKHRNLLQKPLLRRFWGSGPLNQKPPYSVFQARPNNKERMALRRARRSLQEQASKLQSISADLQNVEEILRAVIKRDKYKLLSAELSSCIFDQIRKEANDPTYVNPYWNYLKRTKFANIIRNPSIEPSDLDQWLDSLTDAPSQEHLTNQSPVDLQSTHPLNPHLPTPICILATGGGKSVPGKPLILPVLFSTKSDRVFLDEELDADDGYTPSQVTLRDISLDTNPLSEVILTPNCRSAIILYDTTRHITTGPPQTSFATSILNDTKNTQNLRLLNHRRLLNTLDAISHLKLRPSTFAPTSSTVSLGSGSSTLGAGSSSGKRAHTSKSRIISFS